MNDIRTYSMLMSLPTFEERYEYLKLMGSVGKSTFGFDRFLNQEFYRSTEWRRLRNRIIVRDNACDLAAPDYPINDTVIIHHMNPIASEDIINQTEWLLNPEFLVCVSARTHNAIHFGDKSQLRVLPPARTPNDTCPWKQ